MSRNFALIGAGGYIAPRHLQAIRDTGNKLVAALDRNDSVGVLDRYFDNAAFFVEFERFDRHAEKLRRDAEGERIHYVSICTPNYLHDAHIRFALRIGADAICEKPLVLSPWNLDALSMMEEESGKRIYNILQLRLHPAIIALKNKIDSDPPGRKHNVDLTYITSRGNWYHVSWKGDVEKSGGIATNIGIHFFDMLLWLFGDLKFLHVDHRDDHKISGYLELANANIRWFLSLDKSDIPEELRLNGQTTYRSIRLNGEEIEFSDGFTDLHTAVYRDILEGRGFGIEDARSSINLAYQIRNSKPGGTGEHSHPFLRGERWAPVRKAA
jgi:UDP-N-acetyl-2-amino-2-deoxyglucuronate dehydrogenase